MIFTSWAQLGMWAVEFGGGEARWVHAVMPRCDGCVQIMEARWLRAEGGDSGDEKTKHWCDDGVDVSLSLEKQAMGELLNNPLLRKYSV